MAYSPQKLAAKDRFRKVVPTWFKQVLISLLCSAFVGRLLAWLFSNRIPHINGMKILTTGTSILPETKAAIFFGVYERSEIDQSCTYCLADLPVIELGASIGVNTLQICHHVNTTVIAVEANPELADILRTNLEFNFGTEHRCEVLSAAIDYHGKSMVGFLRSASSLRGELSEEVSEDNTYQVPAVTLSSIVQDKGFDEYVLVLDIEGAEASLFINDSVALKNCRRIIGEFDGGMVNGDFLTIEEIINHLQSINFELIHRHGNRMSFENKTLS